MADLFPTYDTLKRYIFRITDNGGATADRFSIYLTDGDYFGSSESPSHPQGFFQSGEGFDPQHPAETVEAGTERDLRWFDLPASVRRAVRQTLNMACADWLSTFVPPVARADAVDIGTAHRLTERLGEGVYGVPGAYRLRVETYPDDGNGADDLGPYDTLEEAVRESLPDDYDLAGPEYHTTVDLWDESGVPAPLWDCETDPPAASE